MPIDVMATLRDALHQLEAERARIDRQIAAIRSVLDMADGSTDRAVRPRRQRMSPAARRAFGQRMKAYWAKRRAEEAKTPQGRDAKAARKGRKLR